MELQEKHFPELLLELYGDYTPEIIETIIVFINDVAGEGIPLFISFDQMLSYESTLLDPLLFTTNNSKSIDDYVNLYCFHRTSLVYDLAVYHTLKLIDNNERRDWLMLYSDSMPNQKLDILNLVSDMSDDNWVFFEEITTMTLEAFLDNERIFYYDHHYDGNALKIVKNEPMKGCW